MLSERGVSQRHIAWERRMPCRALGNQQHIICMFMILDARWNNQSDLILICSLFVSSVNQWHKSSVRSLRRKLCTRTGIKLGIR